VAGRAAAGDIWRAWTTDEGIRTWLLDDSRIELRVGGPYEWYFTTDSPQGQRGSEGCQVLAFQPPTNLSFTWNAPPHLAGVREQRTVVLLQLRPAATNDVTRVGLTHVGWGDGSEWDEAFTYFDAAWDRVLEALVTYFADAGDKDHPER
jgi:uncharacterized protein YndB with AHSA1/START domain